MTPAEHYEEAERLLDIAKGKHGPIRLPEDVANLVHAAQAHAQLATAGAMFLHGQGSVYPAAHDAFLDAIMPAPTADEATR
jgi:hypothetical protein